MKKVIYFVLLISQVSVFGQLTSVSTGAGYSKQSFYHLSTGTETQLNNDAWDFAFSNSGTLDVGILINESVSSTGNPLRLYLAPTNNWNDNITDLTGFVDSVQLFNPDITWSSGAFNSVKDPNNALDFGWGMYNPQTHVITGSNIFVIQKRDLSYCKLQIQQLSGSVYTFRYANLDGTGEVTKTIDKGDSNAGPLIFYSMKQEKVIDSPKDYDFIFMRYMAALNAGGVIVEYPVTGIVLAPGTSAVKASHIDPLEVDEADYKNDYSEDLQVIGHDWKYFDFNQGWVLDDSTAYFVKTRTKDKYKLVFLEFKGSSTGTAVFLQDFLGNTSSSSQEFVSSLRAFPNPAMDYIQIEKDGQEPIEATLYSVDGRVISKVTVAPGQKLDLQNIDYQGPAVLTLTSNGESKTLTCFIK